MVHTLISVDPKKLPWEQDTPLHNRWHPDIPPVASVKEGEVFRVECVDWTGGQIKNNDSSDDGDKNDSSDSGDNKYNNGGDSSRDGSYHHHHHSNGSSR